MEKTHRSYRKLHRSGKSGIRAKPKQYSTSKTKPAIWRTRKHITEMLYHQHVAATRHEVANFLIQTSMRDAAIDLPLLQ
ncbi:hypothetical protein BST61_g1889 [Cercospora zeina]